jgi:ribonuclease Z
MEEFFSKFDQHVANAIWKPLRDGDEAQLGKNRLVRAIKNGHVPAADGVDKSLSYKVIEQKSKLKPEFSELSKTDLQEQIKALGRNAVTEIAETEVLGFSGDTPVEGLARWENTEILIHEATFLEGDESGSVKRHGNKHSTLDDVLEMAANANIQRLVLGHFSSRYSDEMILEQVAELKKKFGIQIPIHCVLPGRTFRNILNQEPI